MLPLPKLFPHARTAGEVLGGLRTTKEQLKRSLGFANNDNALGQIFFDAFVKHDARGANERAIKGREFARQLEEGKGPIWLLRLCEIYAENELQWRDRRLWPGWLHHDR